MTTLSIAEKRAAFRDLHRAGCFIIPNPWDVASAHLLAGLGFKALATTSSGYAWSQARVEGAISRDQTLAHLRAMVDASDLPINADFESGFATTLEQLADSVKRVVETGVAGFSLEDATGIQHAPVRSLDESVARIRVARSVIDSMGGDTLLVGRAENFIVGVPDLNDTLTRLQAYADAGADCLYAPGITTPEQIRAVVAAVAPKPVNVLISGNSDLTVNHLSALGVRRISVGGALARTAWGGFLAAARAMAEHGRFDQFGEAPSGSDMDRLFR